MTYNLVLTWAATDKQIQVIKAVRAVSGMGLKEAKQLADDFKADRQPRLVRAYETLADAREGLALLRENGYADGAIEQVSGVDGNTEPSYSRAEVTLMLADAISHARSQERWAPSTIIKSVMA